MSQRMEGLLGCNAEQLWENRGRGRGRWSLDHKVPLKAFDLADMDQQLLAFNYHNIQPLWHEENCRKGARLPGDACRR